MKDWICVYSSNMPHQIELIRLRLEKEKISTVIINKQDSFYKVGEIELYVNKDDVFGAIQIINKSNL